MRKLMILALALMLAAALGGCSNKNTNEPVDTSNEKETYGKVYSDESGVCVEIVQLDLSSDPAMLTLKWQNDTPTQAVFGAGYVVEREADGEWVGCPRRDGVMKVPDIAYVLESGKPQNKAYAIGEHFDVSKPGKYRIRSECYLDGVRCTVWAEFDVLERD